MTAKRIIFTDRSIRSVDTFLSEIGHSKPLTSEQEHDLWCRMQNGSRSAREQLIFANLRFVVTIAKSYLPSGAAFEDLIQAGNEGLVKAVDKFDASLGFRFNSFATWFVKNEVRKAAYNYICHNHTSIDEPYYADEYDGETYADYIPNRPCQSADWNLNYREALEDLKNRMDKRQSGLGPLMGQLHQMLLEGYTTSDFARKHRLNEQQMTRLLTMLREEATPPLSTAA